MILNYMYYSNNGNNNYSRNVFNQFFKSCIFVFLTSSNSPASKGAVVF